MAASVVAWSQDLGWFATFVTRAFAVVPPVTVSTIAKVALGRSVAQHALE